MDSRVPETEVAYRPAYPPISTHSPLPPPPPTVPLPWSLPSFSTTTDVPVVDNHLVPVPPQSYSSSYAGDRSASQACAACRFRRQRCKGDCLLAPFFPAADENRFQKALRLFGVIRMQKTLESLLPDQRAVAMATMIYESEVRAAAHPATGSLGIILQLHSQIERKSAHLTRLRQHHSALPPLTPTLDTVIARDGEKIPPTLQSDNTNSIATGNLKRRFHDLTEEQGEETMREPRRRRTSQ